VFLLNSRLGLFSAAWLPRHPFSRSYGVILPSSLTRVLPFVLGFSPRPPVSVCGTGTFILDSSFSRQCEFDGFPTYFRSSSQLILRAWYFTHTPDSLLEQALPSTCSIYPPVSLRLSNGCRWYRNFNRLSIAYSFRSRLRSRLTLRGRTFLRKPWAFDGEDSHFALATHTGILSSISSTTPYGMASANMECSSTTLEVRCWKLEVRLL
jgi:hypothetical protein